MVLSRGGGYTLDYQSIITIMSSSFGLTQNVTTNRGTSGSATSRDHHWLARLAKNGLSMRRDSNLLMVTVAAISNKGRPRLKQY
jgi:hypothetical protein